MKELLEETYGVMVYQEDVIKVAHHFAGLDMAEADVLRRAMSGKCRGHKQFEQIRETYFRLCKERIITKVLYIIRIKEHNMQAMHIQKHWEGMK